MIHTDKPCILGKGDVAALVGIIHTLMGELSQHRQADVQLWREYQRMLRIIEHAQTPDYTAGVE